MTGTFEFCTQFWMRPAPPRGMRTSTRPTRPNSSSTAVCPGEVSRHTASAGRLHDTSASRNAATMASHDLAAIEPPRRMQALPAFRQIPAASEVTLGRASYTMATTPMGTVTFCTERPLESTLPSSVRPKGSGWEATSSRPRAIASTRPSSSMRRSTSEAATPAARASATSTALAARMAGPWARRCCAMAHITCARSALPSMPMRREASFAARAFSSASPMSSPFQKG